jgi:hypothetical protein
LSLEAARSSRNPFIVNRFLISVKNCQTSSSHPAKKHGNETEKEWKNRAKEYDTTSTSTTAHCCCRLPDQMNNNLMPPPSSSTPLFSA